MIEQIHNLLTRLGRRRASQGSQQVNRGLGGNLPVLPIGANATRSFQVLAPGTVDRVVALGRVIAAVLQHGEGQRTHDRLGMAPTNALKCPPGVGGVDGLVTDVAEIACPVAPQGLQNLTSAGRANERNDGPIRAFFIPIVHGFHETVLGLVRGRQLALLDRSHHPAAAFFLIARLRAFEIVDGPE